MINFSTALLYLFRKSLNILLVRDNKSVEKDKLINLSKRNALPLPLSSLLPPPPLPRKVPEQLKNFTNMLEICIWLMKRPHILHLANQMLDAKKSTPNVTPTIFDVSDNISIRSSSVSLGGIPNIANDFHVKINGVRIISYFVIHFFFLFYNLTIIKLFRKNINCGTKQ